MKKTFIAVVAAILAVLVLSHMAEQTKHAQDAGIAPNAGTTATISLTAKPHDPAEPAARLAHMRKHLRPYWVAMEAGGMFLLPSMDEAKAAVFFQDLAARMPPPGREKDMYDTLSGEISEFFETAKFAPGVYRLENYHQEYAVDGKIRFDSDGHEDTALPEGESFDFTVTEDHLKLLRHLNIRSWDAFIEVMDPKRPYGNMTYYFIDMSDALGEPHPPRDANRTPLYTKEQTGRFLKLHREMLFCVQAFWAYAK
jgi:hypothetical protein